MDREQVLRLLQEREAVCQTEVARLEREAERIAELIVECRREAGRLATAREVVSGLVIEASGTLPAKPGRTPDAVFGQQLLAVLAEAGRPVRCRDVVVALGDDPAVARHGERVRHRLKKLVTAGRVTESEPGLFTLADESGRPVG